MVDSKPGIMRAEPDCRNDFPAELAKSSMVSLENPPDPDMEPATAAMVAAVAGFQKGCATLWWVLLLLLGWGGKDVPLYI